MVGASQFGLSWPREKLIERVKSTRAKVVYIRHVHSLSDNRVAAAPQAFHNNGFTPFAGVHGTGCPPRKCSYDGPAQSVAIIIDLAKNSPRTGTQDSGPKRFFIELVLIARK